MDTPQPDNITPRQQYKVAQEHGIPTPLDDEPTYPECFDDIVALFWDIMLYKPEYQSFVPLSLIESYQRLFDIQIHSFVLTIVLKLDRIYTKEINTTLQERQQD